MLNGPILKQCVRAYRTLWIVFTAVTAALLCVLIGFYDASMVDVMRNALEGTPIADMVGGKLASMSSLLGILSESYYGMHAVILPLVYAIIVANSLVAGEVDRGSMAYTLSTSIKRGSVVFTKAVFLAGSLAAMFVVIAGSGLLTAQAVHGCVWGIRYTVDVRAASRALSMDKTDVAADLNLILGNGDALTAGAKARGMDESVYRIYLGQAIQRNANAAAARILGVDPEAVQKDVSLVRRDPKALAAAAKIMGMDAENYDASIDRSLAQAQLLSTMKSGLQDKMTKGLAAAAKALGMELETLSSDLGRLKGDPKAIAAASEASGLFQPILTGMIDQALAMKAMGADKGIDFDWKAFLLINAGGLLLMFAVSGISFLSSCIFNLSKHSIALGAGVPLAFFIFKLVSDMGKTLGGFKYLTLNTLFDPGGIAKGGNPALPFLVLAATGLVLYGAGIEIFKKKDLPL